MPYFFFLLQKEKGLTISTREYNEYNEHFLAALINYDEVMNNDKKKSYDNLSSPMRRSLSFF